SEAGPEEVGMRVPVAAEDASVRCHDLELEDVVAGESPRARGEPEAAAEREPAHADGRARPGRNGETATRKRRVDVDHPGARADRRVSVGIQVDPGQLPEIDDEPVRRRVAP